MLTAVIEDTRGAALTLFGFDFKEDRRARPFARQALPTLKRKFGGLIRPFLYKLALLGRTD